MQASQPFKQAFLKHMLMGLQLGGISSMSMSFRERKKAIKLSADVAMAFARGGRNWSRALITGLCKQDKDKALVRSIIGINEFERLTKPCYHTMKTTTSRRILKRSFKACSRANKGRRGPRRHASVLARSMVKKRTQVLKSLIPGGEHLHDEFSLLDEALDYVVALRAQVDLMRRLVEAHSNQISNLKLISGHYNKERLHVLASEDL